LEKAQSDLFGDAHAVDKKLRKKTRFLLPDIRNSIAISYETVVFVMIGFVMACIIAFSLGVEKGRYDERKRRIIIPQQVMRKVESQPKPELKKGVSNVTAPKLKNIKGR
jgi:hypothetical protein